MKELLRTCRMQGMREFFNQLLHSIVEALYIATCLATHAVWLRRIQEVMNHK